MTLKNTMRNPKPVLNFRVSHSLLAAIDELGTLLYPTPARKDSKLTYDRTSALNDIISAGIVALSNGKIGGQKSNPNSLTESRVEELISNAVSNLPSITESRVEELISNAVSNLPSITESRVEELISNAESNTDSNIKAVVEKAVAEGCAARITTATSPLLERISSLPTRDEMIEKITEANASLDDGEDDDDILELIEEKLAPLREELLGKFQELSNGGINTTEISSLVSPPKPVAPDPSEPCYMVAIYRDGRQKLHFEQTPVPRWYCERWITKAFDPRGDADAGLGADPIDYEIRSALDKIEDQRAWEKAGKNFRDSITTQEWRQKYFSGKIKPEFLKQPAEALSEEVIAERISAAGIRDLVGTQPKPTVEDRVAAVETAQKGVGFPDGLTQAALARRLGTTGSTVARNWDKGKNHFRNWTKNLDPDDIAWELRSTLSKGKYYFPWLS